MKKLIENTFRFFGDIFLEESPYKETKICKKPQNLTQHYNIDYPNLLLDEVIVATAYGDIETILEKYKYHSDRSQANIFIDILLPCMPQGNKNRIITTVPMHWSRYTLRGFNHMDYLAKELSKKSGISYAPTLKTGYSQRQSKLSRKKRLVNRKNQFTLIHGISLPDEIILIDDVISTGATAHECAKILKQNGVKRVIGIFLASSAYT